jgi:hypothetical protein
MDDLGGPISYLVLARNVPVFTAAGREIGRVKRVLVVREKDIFDGIVIRTDDGDRFVDAPEVSRIYERGVVLSIGDDEARRLPRPGENPAALRIDPGAEQESAADEISGGLRRFWNRLTGRY